MEKFVLRPTPCQSCDNVTETTRKFPFHRWCCIKFPKIEGLNPVAPGQWVRDEPYMRCTGINGGFCELFTPKRDGKTPATGRSDASQSISE